MSSANGIILLDKPAGMSSARAVDAVKRLLPRGTKIGHAGTLDPFATGLLVLLVGRATKSCEMLMSQHKSYDATIKLGATTETLDPESPEIVTQHVANDAAQPPSAMGVEEVRHVLPRFIGTIQQRPPAFSAMKIDGKRAYELARKGRAPELQPRPVVVYALELRRFDWPMLDVAIDCGRGTYIRSLARDVGEALGVGGYLTALRRTRTGDYIVQDAASIDQLARDGVERHLLPGPTARSDEHLSDSP